MNSDSVPEVAVIVVNYASSEHLRRLIDSLDGEAVSKVIVWDNYSSDTERERVRQIGGSHRNVLIYEADTNLGFGAAVNASIARWGASRKTVGYYWILNPDVTVRSGALSALLKSRAEHGADIISPLIISPGSERVWYSGGAVQRLKGKTEHYRIGRPIGGADVGYDDVTFVSGAAPLITADAWQRLGGFDERYFLYCEDAELSIRARDAGMTLGVERSAIVEHAEGGSSSGGSGPGEAFYYYVQRNRLNLYAPSSSRANIMLGKGVVETLKLVVLTLRPLDGKAGRRLRASLSGLRAGLRGEWGPRR